MKLLDGNGRKAAVPLLLLSGAGWIMFVVAFGWLNATLYESALILLTWLLSVQIVLLQIKSSLIVAFGWLNANSYENGSQFDDDDRRLHWRWFPFWGFAVGAPVFYLLAFPHLIFGTWHIGIFSNFCVTFVLVTAGGVLYIDGNAIRVLIEQFSDVDAYLTDSEEGRLLIAEFTGCLIAVLFVALYLLTWPCYTDVNNSEYDRNYPQTTPAVQYPTGYVPMSAQPGMVMQPMPIEMQPVPIQMQQAYSPGVVYPMSAAVPPQGVVHRTMSDAAPIPAPKQE